MTEKKVNGDTKTAANMALRRKAISEESHAAVLAGEMSLQEAKDLGQNTGPGGPVGPAPKTISKNDRTRECMCQCGRSTRSRFAPGHDATVKGRIIRAVREGGEAVEGLTDEQRAYGEERDLFRQTRERMAEEERAKAAKRGAE